MDFEEAEKKLKGVRPGDCIAIEDTCGDWNSVQFISLCEDGSGGHLMTRMHPDLWMPGKPPEPTEEELGYIGDIKIEKRDLGWLRRGSTKDRKFHRSRLMFCIRNGKIEVGPTNTPDSHIEWFEKEGWIPKTWMPGELEPRELETEEVEEFLNNNVRGCYVPSENTLYCYKGAGVWFEKKDIDLIKDRLLDLKKALDLKGDTKINFGPKDKIIYGIEHPRHYEGTLEEIISKSKKYG